MEDNNVAQAMNEVLSDYVTENANLRIVIKQLEIELNELRESKEGDDE